MMWRVAKAPDLDPRTTRMARQELILALFRKPWRIHLLEDVVIELERRQFQPSDTEWSRLSLLTLRTLRLVKAAHIRLSPIAWVRCGGHRFGGMSSSATRGSKIVEGKSPGD